MFSDPFLSRALIAGIGIAIITGVMGCFIVWRRMAYFGDSLAHSALLGIAVGLVMGVSPNLGTIIVCAIFALLLLLLQQSRLLATDTLLGILSHAALSIGVVAISLLEQRLHIYDYLFGDILTVTATELWWIYASGIIILVMLLANWSSLLLTTIHEDLARAEGVRVLSMQLLLMFLMTIVVAASIKIVGILLITSMLIIPAATARQLANSPEVMAIIASILGILAVIFGLYGSIKLDSPSGPSIVVASTMIFVTIKVVLAISSLIITNYKNHNKACGID